jgi:hypothetical protein
MGLHLHVTACVAATVLLSASGAAAASVVQVQSFDVEYTNLLHPAWKANEPTPDSKTVTDDTPVDFAAFDPTLGALTGVVLSLGAAQDFTSGVSIVQVDGQSPFTTSIVFATYATDVRLGSASLDAYAPEEPTGQQGCTPILGVCIRQASAHYDEGFNTVFADLSAFQAGGPVAFDLASNVYVSTTTTVFGDLPAPTITTLGALSWKGTATLTYLYDAPALPPGGPASGAPESASWVLMIAGFGLTGALLRRRFRSTNVPVWRGEELGRPA